MPPGDEEGVSARSLGGGTTPPTTGRGSAAPAVLVVAAAGLGATPAAGAAEASALVPTDGVRGVDFAGGTLNTVERTASSERSVYVRQIAPEGSTAGARSFMGYVGPYANGAQAKRGPVRCR
ncbi:hypothetical protein AB0E67_18345 [Streptomyces sp. NPDC032161]|uniref:hypothetical protein n=1 Tax=unclassified Streptomyces TaxID=2593676 RepID=UPI003404CD8C